MRSTGVTARRRRMMRRAVTAWLLVPSPAEELLEEPEELEEEEERSLFPPSSAPRHRLESLPLSRGGLRPESLLFSGETRIIYTTRAAESAWRDVTSWRISPTSGFFADF